MFRRYVMVALMIVLAFILQSTVFKSNLLSFGLVSPNLLLIITFISGFIRGKKSGVIVGFISGILIDIMFSSVIGFHALLYMCVGLINGFFNKIFYDDDILLPLGLLVGSEFLYNSLIFFFRFLLKGDLNFGYYFLHIILPETIYTVFITVFIYRFILSQNKKLDRYERRRAN